MSTTAESSDASILDLLRQDGDKGVAELAEATGVTATAVRQRLNRMMGQGLIRRNVERSGRGRPSYKYEITEKGLRQTGTNYPDLALALWTQISATENLEQRRETIERVVGAMIEGYQDQVRGSTLAERMESIRELMDARNVPFRVDDSGELPVLQVLACPYPDLADRDSAICSLEEKLFSAMLGHSVELTQCRLDGGTCCRFETN